jgi:transposase
LGGIRVPQADFWYRFADVCNGVSYRAFLETLMRAYYPRKVFVVADNARYHKAPEVLSLSRESSHRLELWFLPFYSPEMNAAERIWKYTRKEATHNRFFLHKEEMLATVKSTFRDIQRHPEKVHGYIEPFI